MNRIYPAISSRFSGNHQYLKGKPLDDLGYFTMFFSMAAVGFFYLLPSEILLSLCLSSCWRGCRAHWSSLGATMSACPMPA